jgi:catechol 2,3-dioxygenase-like lactoylglutathione lyase family enzyme
VAFDERATIISMPAIGRVLETSLYVDHLSRSIDFYEDIFAFRRLVSDDRFCALSVSEQQVLLLFVKHATTKPITIPGGIIPPHDGDGETHLAFTISKEDEEAWSEHLKKAGIEIESRVVWPRGGCSLYFRDPDRHLIELVTPGCWEIY